MCQGHTQNITTLYSNAAVNMLWSSVPKLTKMSFIHYIKNLLLLKQWNMQHLLSKDKYRNQRLSLYSFELSLLH